MRLPERVVIVLNSILPSTSMFSPTPFDIDALSQRIGMILIVSPYKLIPLSISTNAIQSTSVKSLSI